MKRSTLFILATCLTSFLLSAESLRREVSVFFRNDVDKIEPEYRSNAHNLAEIDSILGTIDVHPDYTLRSVELTGWASPPARVKYNIDLSHRRADVISRWISATCGVPLDSIADSYCGVNYPLLSRLVKERGYRYADDVCRIIDVVPATAEADHRLQQLRKLHDGVVWEELSREYFPELRRTDVVICYDYVKPVSVEEPEIEEPVVMVDEPKVEPIEVEPIQFDLRPNRYWSVHTNMLYDVLLVPNVGFEVYLGKQFSVGANWHYAWWKKDAVHRYWRTYGGHISGRYWFGSRAEEKPLTGHHIGVYAQALLYDFEFGGVGYLSGTPGRNIFHRPTWGGGIEYGYSLPIGRRLNIDFTIGVGYLHGRYWKYIPDDDKYKWTSIHNNNFIGPTKLEVSLVWLLGHGNYNERKGGEP